MEEKTGKELQLIEIEFASFDEIIDTEEKDNIITPIHKLHIIYIGRDEKKEEEIENEIK